MDTSAGGNNYLLHSPAVEEAEYCDQWVCLCVCLSVRPRLREHITASPELLYVRSSLNSLCVLQYLYPVVYWGYTRVYAVYQPPGFFDSVYSPHAVIINKEGTFRPFATPLCVYPPQFLAIHHCLYRYRIAVDRSSSGGGAIRYVLPVYV